MVSTAMAEALAVLRSTPIMLRTLLAGLPPDVVARPNPEGWSVKDVVAHLHDAESIAFTERIRRMIDEDNPAIQSIDPPRRLAQGDYAARTLPDLLDDLARLRSTHVPWLESLTAEQLARTGVHDTAGTITPRDVVHQWAFHDLAHLRQIMEMLQAGLVPGMGSTRTFYPETGALLAWSR
jgi:DinB superfamily